MNTMPKLNLRRILVCAVLAVSAANSPLYAQSQALTPEQMTQQLRVLSERSQTSASALKNMQQSVEKMGRLIDNRAMVELMQNVDDLSGEISLLRGEMEQQSHDVSELKKRQRELYLDIDRRLRDVESRATAQAPITEPVQVPGLAETVETPAVEVNTPAIETAVSSDKTALISDTSAALSTSAASTPTPSASSSEEQAAYQAAFDTLKEGRYKKAKADFKRFLQQYPDSSFAGNSQYWLGEAHYVTREFDQGITEFERVLARYPGSSKVPDAMLKLGYTYYEKKQFKKAGIMLTELRKRYPKATAARLAGKRLDRMRKEGN